MAFFVCFSNCLVIVIDLLPNTVIPLTREQCKKTPDSENIRNVEAKSMPNICPENIFCSFSAGLKVEGNYIRILRESRCHYLGGRQLSFGLWSGTRK